MKQYTAHSVVVGLIETKKFAMSFSIGTNIAAENTLRNLEQTDNKLSKSLERLSSGKRLNSAADNPAAFVIAERIDGQRTYTDEAIRNTTASIAMMQMADATLGEVSNLLLALRRVAVHAGNEGANDQLMLQSDQFEVDNILDAIDRISNTHYGSQVLFDGSNSVSGVAVGEGLEYLRALPSTKPSGSSGYAVDITQSATKSEKKALRPIRLEDVGLGASGPVYIEISLAEAGRNMFFSTGSHADRKVIDGILKSYQVKPSPEAKVNAEKQLQSYIKYRLTELSELSGLNLDFALEDIGGDSGSLLVVRHRKYGSKNTFQVGGNTPGVLNDSISVIESPELGKDIMGRIGGEAGIGDGTVLTVPENGSPVEGLSIRFEPQKRIRQEVVPTKIFNEDGELIDNPALAEYEELIRSTAVRPIEVIYGDEQVEYKLEVTEDVSEGVEGYVHVDQHAIKFQIDPTPQGVTSISLSNIRTEELAQRINNLSGFTSLRDVDVTSAQGAEDALALTDAAIDQISELRGSIGALQRNTLEPNQSNLQTDSASLATTLSALRDADMAAEISDLTRYQIMQSAGISMLAQANQNSGNVLQLLKPN